VGRRINDRHGVMNAEGTLRVSRDVTVKPGVEKEFVAISSEPAASGSRSSAA
jgi:hypothetical protein